MVHSCRMSWEICFFRSYFTHKFPKKKGSSTLLTLCSPLPKSFCVVILMCFPMALWRAFGSSMNSGISAEQVEINWEQIKNQERAGKADGTAPVSLLDDVPSALPALDRAAKLQKRAGSAGFDWQEYGPVLEKLREEIDELECEVAVSDHDKIVDELGDVLFSCVNLARHLNVVPEAA